MGPMAIYIYGIGKLVDCQSENIHHCTDCHQTLIAISVEFDCNQWIPKFGYWIPKFGSRIPKFNPLVRIADSAVCGLDTD